MDDKPAKTGIFTVARLALLLALVIPASAWSAMIEVTSVVNAATTSSSNVTRSYTSDSYLAVGAGLLVEGKPWGDSSMFSMSGSSMEGLYTESGILYYPRMVGYGTSGTQSSNWLVLPLMEKYHFWDLDIGAGVYVAHAAGSMHTTSVSGTSGSFAFGEGNLRTTDYGYTLALGYAFSFWNLFVDLRDNTGMRNLTTVTNSTYKFSEYQLLLGVRF